MDVSYNKFTQSMFEKVYGFYKCIFLVGDKPRTIDKLCCEQELILVFA